LDGNNCGLVKVLPQHFSGETEEKHKKPVRKAGDLAEI
jgi:hypothetical protein